MSFFFFPAVTLSLSFSLFCYKIVVVQNLGTFAAAAMPAKQTTHDGNDRNSITTKKQIHQKGPLLPSVASSSSGAPHLETILQTLDNL